MSYDTFRSVYYVSSHTKRCFVFLANSHVRFWHARKVKRNLVMTAVVAADGIGISFMLKH